MKKFLFTLTICSVVFFGGTGCADGYTAAEIAIMRDKFLSFENSKNFVLEYSNCIWLAEKKIDLKEYTYQGIKIDRLFGCDDAYFYASIRTKEGENYTIHLLKGDYDTLEMEELGSIENLKESYTSSCRFVNGELYFYDANKHYIYDIETGKYECIKYNSDFFWQDESDYSFIISSNRNDSIVNITSVQTGEVKQVSWKKDLKEFIEGKYIQQFDNKFQVVQSCFVDALEYNGTCYLLGMIPLDALCLNYQAVIFAYDFKMGALSYYSSVAYEQYNYPNLTIINR